MLTITLENERDTERFGAALAEVLPPGTVVALVGTLGAGKTRLVQAVAAALGVPRDAATSPTFVLVNEYRQGRIPVFHFDTYRLKNDDEFLNLGPEEYFESDGLVFVEWADRVAHLLPAEHLQITLELTGDTTRTVTVAGSNERMEGMVDRLQQSLTN